MKTDHREAAFRTKFMNASKHLGVAPDQVISLKFRDIVSSYNEYHEMLRILDNEAGIQSSPIKEDLQGKGHLVGQGHQKIIVVEHETGLELLYIAGSVASIIGLIPLVLRSWGGIRGYFDRRHPDHVRSVEVRRIDSAGNLIEDHSHGCAVSLGMPFDGLNSALFSAAQILESDLQSLRNEVRSHSERLAALEKGLKAPETLTAKKRTGKRSSNKALKKDAAKSRRAS